MWLGVALVALCGLTALGLTAHAARRMIPTATIIKEKLAALDQTMRDELQRGCAAGSPGQSKRCDQSAGQLRELHDRTVREIEAMSARPAEIRGQAMAAIRRFRGNKSLKLSYRSLTANPYRGDGRQMEIYADDQGHEYWIDAENDRLLQIGPGAGADPQAYKVGPEDRLPAGQLRQIALDLIGRSRPDFRAKQSSLHPLEDNKDKEVYFFRWDDFSQPLAEGEMPPFIQVGLAADGRLISFTDTLEP